MAVDWLSVDELKALSESSGGPHVSVYMPTRRAGPETRENPIRLKNRLREAEKLLSAEMRPTLALDMLASARTLEEDYDFWQQQGEGLALFVSEGGERFYRLPIAVPELTVVTERYHLKPLLPLFSEDGLFYLLALSMNQVRVFACSRFSEEELKVEGVPKNMAAALWPDDPEKQLQFHTVPSNQPGGAAIFHGSGGSDRDQKNDLLRYFQRVDDGLKNLLHDKHAPLVVATVDYLHPIFKEATAYRYLLDRGVVGNPEELRPDELRSRAWEVVGPHFEAAKQAAVDRFQQLAGTGQAESQVERVVPAAVQGRVDTLFVAVGVQRWGRLADDGVGVELHDERQPGDEDLLDRAAVATLANRGIVYAVEPGAVPNGSELAAIYRY